MGKGSKDSRTRTMGERSKETRRQKRAAQFVLFSLLSLVALATFGITSVSTGFFEPDVEFKIVLPSFCSPPVVPGWCCQVKTIAKSETLSDEAIEEARRSTLSNAKGAIGLSVVLIPTLKLVFLVYGVNGETINHWIIEPEHQEARGRLKFAALSVQISLHYMTNSNPIAVQMTWTWVIVALSWCALYGSQNAVRDIAAVIIPASFIAVIDLIVRGSVCYASMPLITLLYASVVWFLPGMPLYKLLPPHQPFFANDLRLPVRLEEHQRLHGGRR